MRAYVYMINILITGKGHNIPSGPQAFGHLIGFLAMLVQVIGVIMFVIGLFMLLFAFVDNDSRQDQRAAFFIGVAVILIILWGILKGAGILTDSFGLPDIPLIDSMRSTAK